MIGHEGPSVEAGAAFQNQGCQAVEEVNAVVVGVEDLPALDATDDDVVEGAGVVEAGATGHGQEGNGIGNYLSNSTPSTRETRHYVPLSPPFGATVKVFGKNGQVQCEGVIHDTGAGWDERHHGVLPLDWIDIWLPTEKEANRWGKQWREVEICYEQCPATQ
jgi:hypothetical protein